MKLKFLCALAVMSVASVLGAQEAKVGDIAPRGSLGYARVSDLPSGLKKLGGDTWLDQVRDIWDLAALHESDMQRVQPVVEEIQALEPFLGTVEVALVDVMVRRPHMQLIVRAELKEGAPTEISEKSRKVLADEFRGDAEITATSIVIEDLQIRLESKALYITWGGVAATHVEDLLTGGVEESLAGDERFKKWAESAKSDIDVFFDFQALGRAIDRMGEDIDSDVTTMLSAIEFKKWDYLSASMNIPSASDDGFVLDANVVLTSPLEHAHVWLKSSGGNGITGALPAETLAFAAFQFGGDNEGTARQLFEYFHWLEQDQRPARLRNRIAREEVDIKRMEADIENGNVDEEDLEWMKENIEESKESIKRMKEELESFKARKFEDVKENRQGNETDAEEAWDEIHEFAKIVLGVEYAQAVSSIGSEGLVGVLGPDDPTGEDADDVFDDLGFFLIETDPAFEEWKPKLLERLGGTVPDGASEEVREQIESMSRGMTLEDVPGGKLYRDKNPLDQGVFFFGNGFVGIAATRWTALRILSASEGNQPFDFSNVPHGNTTGSKFGYLDLGNLLDRLMKEGRLRDERHGWNHSLPFDISKLLRGGLRISAATTESPSNIGLTVMTSGETQVGQFLPEIKKAVERDFKRDHDRVELYTARDAIESWVEKNNTKLLNMNEEDRLKALQAVDVAAVFADATEQPEDGLRSAFDPKLQERWTAALKEGKRAIGGEEGFGEIGFDWFGLPTDIVQEAKEHGEEDFETYRYDEGFMNMWLILATKAEFANGEYLAIVHSPTEGFQLRTLTQRVYDALRKANQGGERLAQFEPPLGDVPEWKLPRLFRRNGYWSMNELHYTLAEKGESGAFPDIDFDGRTAGDNPRAALAEAMGVDEEEFWFDEDFLKRAVIKSSAQGFTIRMYVGEHWIEVDKDENWTLSWEKK